MPDGSEGRGQGGVLSGKVAVVTGSDSPGGRAAALTLGAQGAAVVCVCGEETARAITDLGGLAVDCREDMREMDGGQAAIDLARSQFGRLDILCNAAGLKLSRSAGEVGILKLSPETFYAAVVMALRGTFTTTRAAAAVFRKQRSGRLISVICDDGLGARSAAATAMVSEGLVGMTRTVARDLGKYGVTCNAVEADDASAAAALIGALCTDALANVNGRTLGAREGSIFLYAEPEIVAGVHSWGGLSLADLDSLVPRFLEPALGGPS